MAAQYDFDYLIIGSGFGGSVSALRLTEKGYKVAVVEMGKRFRPADLPKSNWNLRKFLWHPALKLHGFFRLTLFRHVFVLSGAGVGGGSLTYGNVLLSPPDKVWDDPVWAKLQQWRKVMPAHYRTARRMLGVITNPFLGKADMLLREAAEDQGCGTSFYPTEVAVYFGTQGQTVPDPFFDGQGPDRTGCELCGGCMAGCRHDGKNTLDKNYLFLAEQGGAAVFPETLVTAVRPLNDRADGSEGYAVETRPSTVLRGGKKATYRVRGVVFAGGVLGTVKLLLELKASSSLPRLSDQVGKVVRTNSESIIGTQVHRRHRDVHEGIAIGSGIYIDQNTHIEAVRYGAGSDALGLLVTPLAGGRPGIRRISSWLGGILANPFKFLRVSIPFGMAKSTIILLVMQTLDNRIGLRLKRSLLPPFRNKLATVGERLSPNIPQANRFAVRMAQLFRGIPVASLTEIFCNVPTTAHILGGAHMGADVRTGVIDSKNRVFNYRHMYVCDGSMIGANLGVNPSLTIAALTEHAMSHIPPNGVAPQE